MLPVFEAPFRLTEDGLNIYLPLSAGSSVTASPVSVPPAGVIVKGSGPASMHTSFCSIVTLTGSGSMTDIVISSAFAVHSTF